MPADDSFFPPSVLDPNARHSFHGHEAASYGSGDFRPVDRDVHWTLSWKPHREIVGSDGAFLNQAIDYALNTDGSYVLVSYMSPPASYPDLPSRWFVTPMQTRRELDDWYQRTVASPEQYHFVAAFDKTSRAWGNNDPVAQATSTHIGCLLSGDHAAALQKIVAQHELHFSKLAELNPSWSELHAFMHLGWDPFLSAFVERVAASDLGDDEVAALARRLSELRANAVALGISVPDIGSTGPTVSGRGGGGRGRRRSFDSGGYDSGPDVPLDVDDAPPAVSGHGGHGGGGHGHGGRGRGRRFFGGGYGWGWGPWDYWPYYYYDPFYDDDQEDEADDETGYDRGHHAQ